MASHPGLARLAGPATFRAARLVLACLITLVGLLYAAGRALVVGLLAGRVQWPVVGLLVAGILAVVLLTAGLPRSRPGDRGRWPWAVVLLLAWVGANASLFALFSGPLTPRLVAVPLFAVTALWVPWLAWLPWWPLSWPVRLAVLAGLLAITPAFPLLLRPAGLAGDGGVNFTWRSGPTTAYASGGPIAPDDEVQLPEPGPDDYPQFLGPSRLTVVPTVRLDRDWKGQQPRLLWRRPVGAGWGGFAVLGGHAFTQEQRGGEECVVCYRVSDGAEVWVHADPVCFDASLGGPGPRATPTIAAGRVFTVGGAGLLNCLDGATGRTIWSVNILDDNGAENIEHGVCGSPLAVEGRVLVCPTGKGGPSLAAYDCATGKRAWRAGQDQASYSSPLLTEFAGVPQVLLYTSVGVSAHDPEDGRLLWSFPWSNREGVNCSQPIPNAGGTGQVFVSTGYGKGAALFRVERGPNGCWLTRSLWQSGGMKTKFTTAVLHGGCAYGLDDGVLACLDLASGERLWKAGRYGHGQVLLAGDLLLVQAENGDVVLVAPDPSDLRELGRVHALSSKTWNNPALAGRFLLVRNDREAACHELALEPTR
jgi:outer membrane protein assembly factor BamB